MQVIRIKKSQPSDPTNPTYSNDLQLRIYWLSFYCFFVLFLILYFIWLFTRKGRTGVHRKKYSYVMLISIKFVRYLYFLLTFSLSIIRNSMFNKFCVYIRYKLVCIISITSIEHVSVQLDTD